jgi:hypothetical protein
MLKTNKTKNNDTDIFEVNDELLFQNILIINEDFYQYPFNVFKHTVETGYNCNWPYGYRTNVDSFWHSEKIKNKLRSVIPLKLRNKHLRGVSYSILRNMYKSHGRWNHIDSEEQGLWANVIYTHPFPIITAGTSINFFENNVNNFEYSINQKLEYKNDPNKWYSSVFFGNRFNKHVMYSSNSFHNSCEHFGNTITNCRCVNTFFVEN